MKSKNPNHGARGPAKSISRFQPGNSMVFSKKRPLIAEEIQRKREKQEQKPKNT
jgi:hypothetical protein